jgi:3-deoxy-D-manno-octulosonate 8-phosphate phosphatase (KDO 8-P phosphatase)
MIDPAVARRIRVVGIDVDGVMTDGGIYLGDVGGSRLEFKRYHIQDGLGIKLLRTAGVRVVIITGRVSESVRLRGDELEADDVVQDVHARKLGPFLAILERYGCTPGDAAFLGDDFPDMSVLRIVGLPVAVGNAVPEIKRVCTLHLERAGGHGAVREFSERLLRARGEWERICEEYVAERSDAAESRT